MLTVLVVDRDEAVRSALGELLENAGYAVVRLEDLDEAETYLGAIPDPVVLVVGNADVVHQPGLQHLTVVAANPETQHAYVYFSPIPQRQRLLTLVQKRTQPLNSVVDGPYELEHLLAIVAAAAGQARS